MARPIDDVVIVFTEVALPTERDHWPWLRFGGQLRGRGRLVEFVPLVVVHKNC